MIFFTRLILVGMCMIGCFSGNAQTAKANVSFPTPNAASLGLYTNIPVSPFTGTPEISIPLYEITEGNVTVPITLSYHSASVRVHTRPGWTGLGWSLQPGGAITRVMNGKIDEYKTKHSTPKYSGFLNSFYKLNDPAWDSNGKLDDYAEDYEPSINERFEAMPDEFSFNFLGYSGKFFMGHDGQWKVVCDTEIKVILDQTNGVGMINEDQLRPEIYSKIQQMNGSDRYLITAQYINKFTLVTPDGVSFEFGGINATEYAVQFRIQGFAHPIPTTYYLTKIINTTGQEITFNYQPGNLIANLSQGFYSTSFSSSPTGMFGADCSGSTGLETTPIDGYLLFPVYLTSINHLRGNVEFQSAVSNSQLRWPEKSTLNQQFGTCGYGGGVNPLYFETICNTYPDPPPYNDYDDQLQWRQLNRVRIVSYSSTSYFHRDFEFTYTNDANTRLKLLEFVEKNYTTGESKPAYKFTYNKLPLPSYGELKSNDHWDFYNGFDPADFPAVSGSLSTFNTSFINARAPDATGTYMKAEMLEQVQYPTGGVSRFEYEPHLYSKLIDRQTVVGSNFPVVDLLTNRVGGGLRIRKISMFDKSDSPSPSLVKEYYYVKGYKTGADPSTLLSSGVLAGLPKYYWPNYQGKRLDGNTFTYTIFSSGSLLPFGYNTEGTHIGYSEVVVVSRNVNDASLNGYTKYNYSNFDQDIWNNSHLDEVGKTNDPNRSVYSPFSSVDIQRGRILSEEVYANDRIQPVKKVTYQYTASSGGYVRRVLQEPFDVCGSTTASAQTVYVTAFKTYMYRYNLTSKQTTQYDGSNSFTMTTTYEYTPQNFLSRTTDTHSDGTLNERITRYPSDFTTDGTITTGDWEGVGLSKLIAKNMLNSPVELYEKKNGKVTKATLIGYLPSALNVYPYKVWSAQLDAPLVTGVTIGNGVGTDSDKFNPAGFYNASGNKFRKDEHYTGLPITYAAYDNFGHPQEISNSTVNITKCYLWGHHYSLPVVEIIGANYAQIPTTFGGFTLATFGTNYFGDEVTFRAAMTALRAAMPNARISSYTYRTSGLTSQTDANGRTTYYEYDSFGRLLRVKDHDLNIIQTYTYNYRNN